MDVVRRLGVALWQQIQQQLEDDIIAGSLTAGSRMPAEHALAKRFAVNRHTVRRAIAALAEKGLVRVEQGRGTFIQVPTLDYPVDDPDSPRETISGFANPIGSELLLAASVPATSRIAQAMGINGNETLTLLRILRRSNDHPLAVYDYYFPARRLPTLIDAYMLHGSIVAALAACGVANYSRRSTRVTARMPSREEIKVLAQPANRPVLVSVSVNIDGDGQAIEYGVAVFAAARVQLLFEP